MTEPTSDPKQLLQAILDKVNALTAKVDGLEKRIDNEREARSELSETATETLVNYSDAIKTMQQGVFALSALHLDLVAPQRKHADPAVAAEADDHAQLAMVTQAQVAPTLFEAAYGLDAQTWDVLPGREPGVPLTGSKQAAQALGQD